MSLNVQKSKLLFLKGSASCKSGDSLELVSQQKDLGVIISRNLSWSDICSRRKTKACRSFWFLKRNCSHKANPVTKLNAFVGYVVPVLTYASQVWNASKTDLKSLERVQRKATAGICGTDADYKQRLLKLNVLPVSLYLELHHILFFNAICQDKFALDSNDKPKSRSTETRQNENLEVPFNRLKKTNTKFWTCTARLMNILNKHIPGNELTKSRLTKMYHEFFDSGYNKMEPCTWRILCLCGSCNPAKKIVPAEN